MSFEFNVLHAYARTFEMGTTHIGMHIENEILFQFTPPSAIVLNWVHGREWFSAGEKRDSNIKCKLSTSRICLRRQKKKNTRIAYIADAHQQVKSPDGDGEVPIAPCNTYLLYTAWYCWLHKSKQPEYNTHATASGPKMADPWPFRPWLAQFGWWCSRNMFVWIPKNMCGMCCLSNL